MVRRSISVMVTEAKRLPWHASLLVGRLGLREGLLVLQAWARATLPPDDWFYPISSGKRSTGFDTDTCNWAFAKRWQAERFVMMATWVYGEAHDAKCWDSRASREPPWGTKP